VLNPGFIGDEALVREIQQHVKTRLAAHEYPREIRFVESLPLTATGKVIRKALRAELAHDAENPTGGNPPTPHRP
jgi:acetyl-CoA synthetase